MEPRITVALVAHMILVIALSSASGMNPKDLDKSMQSALPEYNPDSPLTEMFKRQKTTSEGNIPPRSHRRKGRRPNIENENILMVARAGQIREQIQELYQEANKIKSEVENSGKKGTIRTRLKKTRYGLLMKEAKLKRHAYNGICKKINKPEMQLPEDFNGELHPSEPSRIE